MHGISNINFGNVTSRRLISRNAVLRLVSSAKNRGGVGTFCLDCQCFDRFPGPVSADCDLRFLRRFVFITTYIREGIVDTSALNEVDITSKLRVAPYLIAASKDYS
jgi:hypothetical protein